MTDLKKYYDLVEEVIKELGVDPQQCKGDEEGQWNLQKGEVPVWIDVFFDDKNQGSYIQVMAPIIEMPIIGREAFLIELLEVGHELFGVAFTKFENWIYLKSIRETEGLDKSELQATMNRIGSYSEDYAAHFKKYLGDKAPGDSNERVTD